VNKDVILCIQPHAVLCVQVRRRLRHGLLPPPALGEGGHGGLARRLTAAGLRAYALPTYVRTAYLSMDP
jgi:hypothetical protein